MLIRGAVIMCCAVLLLATAVQSASSHGAHALKLVVPVAPGGALDYLARLLGAEVEKARGHRVMVESRPGAGTAIGTEIVARAAADGDTLLLTAGGNLLISPHVRTVNYDPLADFEPVCALVRVPTVIAVHGTAPFRTFADLIGAARARPGQLTLASVGPASDLQIVFEKLKHAADINMIYVPYSGVAPAVNALLGQHVTSIITSYSSASEQLKAGTLRALALTTGERIDVLPDLPTIAESGYPNYQAELWFGLFAPAKTPHETIARLGEWFSAAVQSPDVRQKLAIQGLHPMAICGGDFAALVRRDYDEFGRIIHEAKISVQ